MLIGQKIKKLRELKNLTQEYVAEQLHLTQSGYSKIETGEVDVPYTRLEEIAKILTIKVEDIINFNENMVFNIMHNQTGNGLVINHHTSDNEKKLYEDQIQLLKEQVEYLKNTINRLLEKSK